MVNYTQTYICPMHPEIQQSTPGNCPKCHMKLVKKGEETSTTHTEERSYRPLIIIIALITFVTLVVSFNDGINGIFSLEKTLSYFMAGFFLVFSGFKLLDLKGFAQGYSTYDLLAQKVPVYGYIYPFLELYLGLASLVQFQPQITNIFGLIVMTFSGLGVLRSMMQKRTIQCACLGTFLKVPLTTVTLIEDFGMAFLSILMLIL